MINIVIPMAGAGSRFVVEGYKTPKPFIEFNNKMMIEHVLNSFKSLNVKYTIVIQEKFLKDQKLQLEKLKNEYKVEIVTVPKLTMGAAVTSLAAHLKIDPNIDLIFSDSDNIFNPNDIFNFVQYVREKNLDGALLTFNANNPCFSYAEIGENQLLVRTKEKEVISNHAITGVYYFKNKQLFINAVIDLLVEADLQNGEFYMSNVYNHLMKFSKNIGIFDIDNFDCVGTPQQLQMYMEKNIEKV